MRLGEVLAVRPVPLEEVRHRVEPEPVDAEVEPEAQHLEHRLLHLRVVEVEVGLVVEEAVPEVLAAQRVERPVGGLAVDEDDARLGVALVRLRPDVPLALRVGPIRPRFHEPWMVGGGVVHHEIRDHAHAALVRLLDELAEVVHRPVVGVEREEVRDVVAAVAQRRLVHRQQPEAVDAEPLEIVELVDQAAEVTRAVVVAVEEPADVDLVEDGPLEPERIPFEPLLGHQDPILSRWLWPGPSLT